MEKCKIPGLRAAHIGMGMPRRWHGTPDVHIRGSTLLYARCVDGNSRGTTIFQKLIEHMIITVCKKVIVFH